MTVQEAIAQADSLMHNTYSDSRKRQWLAAVDGMIRQQIIATHEGSEELPSEQESLLACAPYDALYLHYLQAQMHYHNAEFDRFNNANAMFQAAFDSFRNYYNRTHAPLGAAVRYF